jgi:carbonic anhydrase
MSKLTFDIKDNDTKDIFDNNPFLINITGSVNICEIRCGQEIDNCNSIKINTMTNYGNILSLNTDTNIKCNVKLPYESEGDNKNYIFKKIFVSVPSLHRINNTIYDMEIFIVFTSMQKDGTKF